MSPTSHAPQAAPVTYTAPSISTEFSENEYRMAHTSGNNTDKGRVAWIHRYLGDGPLKNTVAGAAAGCVSGVITCPLDVVKTRLQHQALVKHQSFVPYKGSISKQCFKYPSTYPAREFADYIEDSRRC
ncbi:hypothetical protein H4219_001419 [Mycoemilia scoparia]|uniref:Uncharacterized protein n=1 Tax=Mycoemilia scoparia TaxID=417184 RepID=A0A9W8A131_9FUNG|nr:hypothetical protein H4219_001419 [Mycoemilia scoparia]